MRGPGEARLLASGALLQQLAQGCGLLALLAIVTLLARRVEIEELAAFGLISTLAGYLLVMRNSVSNAAVRAMAAAPGTDERSRLFSAAALIYVVVGLGTGLLIAVVAVVLAGAVFDGELERDARAGGLGLAAVTAVGISSSVFLDVLRAERRFVRAAGAELVSVAIYAVVMVALILSGAELAVVIAASGLLPLITGILCAPLVRRGDVRLRIGAGAARGRARAIAPTAGWLLVVEVASVVTYASGRIVLGALQEPRRGRPLRGPGARAQPAATRSAQALAPPTVPTASRYVAGGDERRAPRARDPRQRATRSRCSCRSCVTLMALAEPILTVWLGERYDGRRHRAHDRSSPTGSCTARSSSRPASWSGSAGRARWPA